MDDSKTKPTDPKSAPVRDINHEVIQEDWWLKLTRIFHRLIGKN